MTVNHLNEDGSCKTLQQLKLEIIATRLKFHKGSVARTAKTLGISRLTIYRNFHLVRMPK